MMACADREQEHVTERLKFVPMQSIPLGFYNGRTLSVGTGS